MQHGRTRERTARRTRERTRGDSAAAVPYVWHDKRRNNWHANGTLSVRNNNVVSSHSSHMVM
jgi:hypothetical protein